MLYVSFFGSFFLSHKKHLLFLLPCSYQRALLRTIVPRVLILAILESLNFIRSSSVLRESLYDVWNLVCNLIISDKRIDSSSRFRLAFFFEKTIVKLFPSTTKTKIVKNGPFRNCFKAERSCQKRF